jgi:hypothetical protein
VLPNNQNQADPKSGAFNRDIRRVGFLISGRRYGAGGLFWTFGVSMDTIIQDVSGNSGEMPIGKDLKRKSIKAGAGKTI